MTSKRTLSSTSAATKELKASVIVLTRDGLHHLQRCIPALVATVGADTEILVVDNASTDGTVEWLAATYPQLRRLPQGRNLGFGEGNRCGIAAAQGRYVVLLNNDTVVAPGWLEALLAPLEADPEVAASCATLRLLADPKVLNAFGGVMAGLGHGVDRYCGLPVEDVLKAADASPWQDCLFPSGAAMAMRREEFSTLGGFDRSFFMYHEDVDLGWRLWLLGRRVVVCRAAIVGHAFLGSAGAVQSLGWRARLGLRHLLRSQLKHRAPGELPRVLAGLAAFLVRERALVELGHVALWNLVHLPGTLYARWWLQRRRVRSTAELVKRGLILETALPPPTPELPRTAVPQARIESSSLWPGRPSAAGRLGVGWYEPEETAVGPVRHTCGHGWATLHLAPGRHGDLEVELRSPPGLESTEVELRCGSGQGTVVSVGPEWRVVAVPGTADTDGRLEVEVRSGVAQPSAVEPRILGCAVRRIELRGEPRLEPPPSRVSVVIPTYNRWAVLSDTLDALDRQTWRQMEVVVVDDGSGDGSFERLQELRDGGRLGFPLTVLHQPNSGQGVARNLGIGAAEGDLVLVLGDDILPEPDCVAEHVAAHRRLGQAAAVVGLSSWDEGNLRITPFMDFVARDGAQFAWDRMEDGREVGCAHFYTSNVSLPREVAGAFPFDPAFAAYGWEDIELGSRLELAGLPIVFDRRARARHRHPTTVAEFLARQRLVGRTYRDLLERRPDLEGDRRLPSLRRPRRFGLETPAWWLAAPAIGLLDRVGIRLPWVIYRELVRWAFYIGLGSAR